MFKFKLEGFGAGSAFVPAIATACQEVARLSGLAVEFTRPRTRAAMEEWFGTADNGDVWANIWRLHKVITDGGRTVTFVNAVGKILRMDYNPNNIAATPTPSPPEVMTHAAMAGTAAWVYPTNTRDGTRQTITDGTPLFHTGSGMRLYLGNATVSQARINLGELIQTIYHELSHKVIGTNDHIYGYNESKGLIADGRALKNADNYGYFLLSVD